MGKGGHGNMEATKGNGNMEGMRMKGNKWEENRNRK